MHNNDWVPVMDEAWEMFALDPPKRMKVQIIEEPTETEQRMSDLLVATPGYVHKITRVHST